MAQVSYTFKLRRTIDADSPEEAFELLTRYLEAQTDLVYAVEDEPTLDFDGLHDALEHDIDFGAKVTVGFLDVVPSFDATYTGQRPPSGATPLAYVFRLEGVSSPIVEPDRITGEIAAPLERIRFVRERGS